MSLNAIGAIGPQDKRNIATAGGAALAAGGAVGLGKYFLTKPAAVKDGAVEVSDKFVRSSVKDSAVSEWKELIKTAKEGGDKDTVKGLKEGLKEAKKAAKELSVDSDEFKTVKSTFATLIDEKTGKFIKEADGEIIQKEALDGAKKVFGKFNLKTAAVWGAIAAAVVGVGAFVAKKVADSKNPQEPQAQEAAQAPQEVK